MRIWAYSAKETDYWSGLCGLLGDARRPFLAVANCTLQERHNSTLPIDRAELACIPEPMTEKEAWAKFEDGLKDTQSFDEAVAWVKKNKKIVEKLTMMAMIRRFNEDISKANRTWRN